MKNKNILFMLSIFVLISIIGLTSAACCEKTDDGALCQDVVDANNCDAGYRVDENTACDSTPFCSIGTCVDRNSGDCVESPQASCDPELGGYWYDQPSSEVAECSLGCCLIGDGAAFVERVTCDTMGSDYNVIPTFKAEITDSASCFELAGLEKKGACVFQSSLGRDCDVNTRNECQGINGEFHEDFLCTAPELGTVCTMTQQTTCVDGKNEVYYTDSCGNVANIYDASKIENIEYWTYIKDVSDPLETCGVGDSNTNSEICGNCNYNAGSTCGEGNADYGDYVCRDMGCDEGPLAEKFQAKYGRFPNHAEEWCSDSLGNLGSLEMFEDATPGEISYLSYCYDGEINYELCDPFRNKICMSDLINNNENKRVAACVVNRWQDCWMQNTSSDCLNEDARDCEWEVGSSYLLNEFGDEKKIDTGEPIDVDLGIYQTTIEPKFRAACIPKYTPAFNFWEPTTEIPEINLAGQDVCKLQSSMICTAYYTHRAGGTWQAWDEKSWDNYSDNIDEIAWGDDDDLYDDGVKSICFESGIDTDKLPSKVNLKNGWIDGRENLCIASGDCGIKQNYVGEYGYGTWAEMFTGDIKKDNIN